MKQHPTCTQPTETLRENPRCLYVPEVGPSLNEFYAGMHYAERTKLADDWKWIVQAEVSQQRFTEPNELDFPLRVVVRAHFPDRRYWYDSGNIGATEKLIVDGLRASDVLPDDDPRHVFGTTLETWLHDGGAEDDRFTLLLFRSV